MSGLDPDDWRLANAKSLRGLCLQFKAYRRRSEIWDHDHCAGCWAKFAEADGPGIQRHGYTTRSDYKLGAEYEWVCTECFYALKTALGWTVLEAMEAENGGGESLTVYQSVMLGVVPLWCTPDRARQESGLLYGERVSVLERQGDLLQVGVDNHGYQGWVEAGALGPLLPDPTHRVAVPLAYVRPEPDVKAPPVDVLSFWSGLVVGREEGAFVERAGGGWVPRAVLVGADAQRPDIAETALLFREVPYLWGGRSAQGIDCSGLVQLACFAAGRGVPRDSGPQREAASPVAHAGRGDLAFWPGHVAILMDADTVIHANAHHNRVAIEPLASVEARVGKAEIKRL